MFCRLKILCAATFIFVAPIGNAEQLTESDAEKQAKVQFEEGVHMFKEGNFDGASIAFSRAYELRPSYKILYNVGQVESELKHYSRASDAYKQYLAQGGEEVDTERRNEVNALIERLQMLVGSVEIQYSKDGVTVLIDGERRGTTPLQEPVIVDMGTHVLSLRDGINEVYQESIRIAGGQHLTLALESEEHKPVDAKAAQPVEQLPANAPAPVAAKKAPEAGPPVSPLPVEKKKRRFTWIALGVAAAAGISGGIVGGIAMGKESSLTDKCEDSVCDESLKSEADTIHRMDIAADVLFGITAAAAVAGIVLFVVEPRHRQEKPVALLPIAHPTFLGVEGRF